MENISELFLKGFDMSKISPEIMEGKTIYNTVIDSWLPHGLPMFHHNRLHPVDAFSLENKDNIISGIHDLLSLLFPSMAMHQACPSLYSNPEHKKIIAAYILSKHFTYDI